MFILTFVFFKSADEESDGEIEKNLMIQKEQVQNQIFLQINNIFYFQLRALQGQKRALLALKRRSEQRLIEQQELTNKKPTNEEDDLLSDINNLRDRYINFKIFSFEKINFKIFSLKSIRNLYEQKYQDEIEFNSSNKPAIPTENRLKNLEHIRERLDELEQIITYYQPDDTQQTTNNNPPPKQLDELTAKRL